MAGNQSLKDLAYRTIAAAFGAPVDITQMVMRPFGYSTPEREVVGGSEWIGKQMEEAGLIGSAREPLQEFAASLFTPGGAAKGAAIGIGHAAPLLAGIGSVASKVTRKPLIISSQRYIDPEIVAKKIQDNDFTVKVSPVFSVDGESYQVVQDGHHALEAAREAGVTPKFVIQTAQENDRVGLLQKGKVNDFLDASYNDSPYYDVNTGKDVW